MCVKIYCLQRNFVNKVYFFASDLFDVFSFAHEIEHKRSSGYQLVYDI